MGFGALASHSEENNLFSGNVSSKYKKMGSYMSTEEAESDSAASKNEISGSAKPDILVEDTTNYCKKLVNCEFYGQTNKGFTDTDHSVTKDILNLGYTLKLSDKIVRSYEPGKLTTDHEHFQRIGPMLAMNRKKDGESTDECAKRLWVEFRRFVQIYNKRGKFSEVLEHKDYWGTRQQLLSGKVIADYIDPKYGPLDPIFGVLLNPTTGRVGPSDSGVLHEILFDDNGDMAYHAAVHDAFGYLKSFHDIGPGYDYLDRSYLDDTNCMAGQTSGIAFWSQTLSEMDTKLDVIRAFKM